MNNVEDAIDEIHYQEALKRYAENYLLKKRKSTLEKVITGEDRIYVIYARKSTEDDQRQMQSIEDQIEQCQKFARKNRLNVIEIIREEKSAKEAGKRERFSKMIETIKEGTSYNSILAWHPDRLARNMKESGEILDLLDKGVIRDLKFDSYVFNNDPAGKMTLSILFAMAKEFSDKLSEDTKRGVRKKVSEGKYCGSSKKGYIPNKDGYFRKEEETFYEYQSLWKKFAEGVPQTQLAKEFKSKGIDSKHLSHFFMDPFYAGLYCYGDKVIDIKAVDPKFTPMVTPKEFMMVQREYRKNPRGWHISDEFRPFNELVICAHCGNYMISGLSTNDKKEKYLYISCGSNSCRESRKSKGIKPIVNSTRGKPIMDLAIKIIQESLSVDETTYEKIKEKYIESRVEVVKVKNDEITTLKSAITKTRNKYNALKEKLYTVDDPVIQRDITNDMKILNNEVKQKEDELKAAELQKSEFEYGVEIDFPQYKDYVNFFGNIVTTLQTTDNTYLIDQLVKLVCVNVTVKDKKIVKFTLREPFETYQTMKFLSGVEDGT